MPNVTRDSNRDSGDRKTVANILGTLRESRGFLAAGKDSPANVFNGDSSLVSVTPFRNQRAVVTLLPRRESRNYCHGNKAERFGQEEMQADPRRERIHAFLALGSLHALATCSDVFRCR